MSPFISRVRTARRPARRRGEVTVSPLPDAASIPPDVPTSYPGSQPLGDVGLALYNNYGELSALLPRCLHRRRLPAESRR